MKPDQLKLRQISEKLLASEPLLLGAAALTLGLATGVGVWLFKQLIELAHAVAFDRVGAWLGSFGNWTVVLIPALGGLVVGLIVHFLVGEERHHGVAGIMESVALAGGRLRYRRIPAKAAAAAVSIGSGASVGPEDPSVQIGANLGSMFGQYLHMSDERMRTLVAAGSAAAIAAAFNAPIAGVFFALEIVLGEVGGSGLGMVVVAAVVSSVFTQAVSGTQPAFHVPAYALNSIWELPLYLVLGLLAGPIAAVYISLLYTMQDFFRGLHLPRWVKPAVAGLGVGLVGLFLPQIFGVGYETIEQILGGEYVSVGLLLALLVAKLVLTPVSIGGGFMGGVFAPSLFIGATLGDAYGLVARRLFPNLGIAEPAFAMVGMAAVLAGAVHAPLTAILLLFEMTHDYRIILPLMFSVAVSMLVAQFFQHDSVYTLGLARKGIRLNRGRDVEVLQAITVAEVMYADTLALPESTSLEEAAELFANTRRHGLPVTDENGDLVGIFTVQDLDAALSREKKLKTVGEACTRQLVIVYPDETLGTALRRMSQRDLGRLPVVARDNPRQLLGVLRRSDVIRSYEIALARRASLRHRTQQVRLDAVSPETVDVIEVAVEPGSKCERMAMKDIPWPQQCIIATLRRGRQVLIPHGDTVLEAGDVLAVVAEGEVRQEVFRLCRYKEDL
jgi:chloride channel protein, CIC family